MIHLYDHRKKTVTPSDFYEERVKIVSRGLVNQNQNRQKNHRDHELSEVNPSTKVQAQYFAPQFTNNY